MSTVRQIWIITLVAVVGFFGLRSLPDTQCTFLHADHQPVVVDGLEFCGLNEEANFYSPYPIRSGYTSICVSSAGKGLTPMCIPSLPPTVPGDSSCPLI